LKGDDSFLSKGNDLFLLIKEFIIAQDGCPKLQVRDAIFSCLYTEFDKWIKIVFRQRDISYSPDKGYYNDVFFEIYERIFALDHFKKILSNYDLLRQSPITYFSVVTQNAVRDWLRKNKVKYIHRNLNTS
jgi:hypothetical protein